MREALEEEGDTMREEEEGETLLHLGEEEGNSSRKEEIPTTRVI